MLIAPSIDSGPTIHDYHSDGKELHWILDNTRDGMSANKGKKEYVFITHKEAHHANV